MNVSRNLSDGEHKFFCRNEGAVSGVLYKNSFVSDLLGSQHSFEILKTSFTFKNSEICGKKWMFRKTFAMKITNFFPK